MKKVTYAIAENIRHRNFDACYDTFPTGYWSNVLNPHLFHPLMFLADANENVKSNLIRWIGWQRK
jgi:hypothetical protein